MSTKQVSKAAFKFTSPLHFEATAERLPGGAAPISMHARAADPIEHWHWGRIVHDFDGMRHKERIPVDWAHGDEIGYLDKFEVQDDGLHVGGEIVPFRDDDKASEVLHRGQAGVPYEASIDWTGEGTKIQEVTEGETTFVNGRQMEGPLTVVREWPLRAVAVCKFGQDGNTQTHFENDQETQEISIFSEETMSDETKQDEAVEDTAVAVEEAPVEVETPEETTVHTAPNPDAQKFIDAFGDRGARWFIEGISFEEAQRRQLTALQEELKAAKDQAAAAKAAVGTTTVTEHTEPGDEGEPKKKGFAQFIRMPAGAK